MTDAKLTQVAGQVVREHVNVGSKSEREAVVLKTERGAHYVLRRQGAPALGDASLDPLVGKAIQAEGVEVGSTLIMRDWKLLSE